MIEDMKNSEESFFPNWIIHYFKLLYIETRREKDKTQGFP